MLRRLRETSLRNKLVLSAILCVVVPSLLTAAFSNIRSKEVIREQTVQNVEASLDVIQLYINKVMDQMIHVSNYIYFDSDINNVLRHKWEYYQIHQHLPDFSYEELQISGRLDNLNITTEKQYITVVSSLGSTYSNYSFPQYLPEQSFFRDVLDIVEPEGLEIRWLAPHDTYVPLHPRGSQLISLVRNLNMFSGNSYGYLVISIDEERVRRILQQYSPSHEVMLLDENGRIISHTNPEKIDRIFRFERREAGASEDELTVWANPEQFIMVSKELNHGQWKLVSLVPYQYTDSQLNSIYKEMTVIQMAFAAFFLILMLSLVNRFTRPLVDLNRTVEKVEAGDLSVRSRIRVHNEIGRLARSFDHMLSRIQGMIQQIKDEQIRKRKIELELLQAQINPHFLFNILNSIRLRLKLKKDRESADLIEALSSLLRMTINRNNEYILLHEEVDTIDKYVRLMNFRHQERIDLQIDLASDTISEEIPRFTLQPLIENAIIHGLEQKSGTIIIRSWKHDGFLRLVVEDSGKGMTKAQIRAVEEEFKRQQSSAEAKEIRTLSGIGLKNVHDRLRIIYGGRFAMKLEAGEHRGLKITLKIPLHREEEEYGVQSHAGR